MPTSVVNTYNETVVIVGKVSNGLLKTKRDKEREMKTHLCAAERIKCLHFILSDFK